MTVLDASALLALFLDEPGADGVEAVLEGALMSTVNLGEVLSRIERDGKKVDEAMAIFRALPIVFIEFSVDQAMTTAALGADTRSRGLSFGDRACLTLAIERGRAALTADRAWAGVDVGVEIRLIR